LIIWHPLVGIRISHKETTEVANDKTDGLRPAHYNEGVVDSAVGKRPSLSDTPVTYPDNRSAIAQSRVNLFLQARDLTIELLLL
jgi:hypothetical protein